MARQNMRPQPWLKHMDAFEDFSGGQNSRSANDNLSDNELLKLQNADIEPRGKLKRRTGIGIHRRSALWSDIGFKEWSEL
jgi:hypothetical protein